MNVIEKNCGYNEDRFRELFLGYPDMFYKTYIPYDFKTYKVHDSFAVITEQLRESGDVPKILKYYDLPECKSFKATIYERQGLLFC